MCTLSKVITRQAVMFLWTTAYEAKTRLHSNVWITMTTVAYSLTNGWFLRYRNTPQLSYHSVPNHIRRLKVSIYICQRSMKQQEIAQIQTCYHQRSCHCRHYRFSNGHWRRNYFADRTTMHTSGNSSIDTSLIRDICCGSEVLFEKNTKFVDNEACVHKYGLNTYIWQFYHKWT